VFFFFFLQIFKKPGGGVFYLECGLKRRVCFFKGLPVFQGSKFFQNKNS